MLGLPIVRTHWILKMCGAYVMLKIIDFLLFYENIKCYVSIYTNYLKGGVRCWSAIIFKYGLELAFGHSNQTFPETNIIKLQILFYVRLES